ncbi:hypothetical protein NLI96_g3104 [Meripilus lineatus]|uniref:F-box domain-containing protein n=1 Tax=Meripilus lineatus TaxID=2056292 RepID=A0AAD5YLA9_9APHY|nr:hypothetical protein NLI96_g3104 [Physisporinus lineatus]
MAESDKINPRLPQEIVDHIVECLNNDKESLRTCSLAATTFLNTCRKFLFRDILIPSPEKLARFLAFLQSPSGILVHVQMLSIRGRPEMANLEKFPSNRSTLRNVLGAFAIATHFSPRTLGTVLSQLPALRGLDMSFLHFENDPTDVVGGSLTYQKFSVNRLRFIHCNFEDETVLPNIVDLFSRIDELNCSDAADQPKLASLGFRDLSTPTDVLWAPPSRIPRLCLTFRHYFTLGSFETLLKSLTYLAATEPIHDLRIYSWRQHSYQVTRDFLRTVGPQLMHFSLDLELFFDMLELTLNANPTPRLQVEAITFESLQSLTLRIYMGDSAEDERYNPFHIWKSLVELLAYLLTTPCSKTLRVIRIAWRISHSPVLSRAEALREADWHEFSHVVENFPVIERVEFVWTGSGPGGTPGEAPRRTRVPEDRLQAICDLVTKRLPGLHSRGPLSFSFS